VLPIDSGKCFVLIFFQATSNHSQFTFTPMPTREVTLLPNSTIVDFASNILNSLVHQRDKLMRKDFASNILNSLVHQRDKKPLSHRQRIFYQFIIKNIQLYKVTTGKYSFRMKNRQYCLLIDWYSKICSYFFHCFDCIYVT
jgi:hypothetical protein